MSRKRTALALLLLVPVAGSAEGEDIDGLLACKVKRVVGGA